MYVRKSTETACFAIEVSLIPLGIGLNLTLFSLIVVHSVFYNYSAKLGENGNTACSPAGKGHTNLATDELVVRPPRTL